MKFKGVLILLAFLMAINTTMAAEKTVHFATLDWEPYVGQNIKNNGYVTEIVIEAFKRSGYTTEIIFYPWARAVRTAEYGEVDGIFPEYYDEGRKKSFVFSDPFPGGPVGLYKRKDTAATYSVDPQTNQTEALRGLAAYRFGVVRGYINTAEFDAADFLKKDEGFSDEINIKKLYNRRIDFMFIDKFVAEHLITDKFPEFAAELEFMVPPLENKLLYVAFSKQAADYQEKLSAFNQGLAQITADGTLAAIIKRHGFEHHDIPIK
ncbi:substrate-binding periplasmic protein [Desulfopila aestuarii]|uniref:Amino acid ABC transporter substrate-binding protein, PAAT family (TC 3.A.1.3.-) n=1 Tax=Desulfopila aestuarii DSM 18488 TaxID=1121416 RepID=A0A1M7Y4P3_9BACT|nr:transporter substrate-binding domain-containing protein [Desulfopila aestuarii]SHO47291.1 amino acid ABC transporter substrate-binding protein, PAAT family (TC 3.A.1.3.-) [Desulfopila aestuarii DSM 18488]